MSVLLEVQEEYVARTPLQLVRPRPARVENICAFIEDRRLERTLFAKAVASPIVDGIPHHGAGAVETIFSRFIVELDEAGSQVAAMRFTRRKKK